MNEMALFLHVDTNSNKLKIDAFFRGWVGMVKNGYDQSCHQTLKLTESHERRDGIKQFFACCCKFRKAKSRFNDF